MVPGKVFQSILPARTSLVSFRQLACLTTNIFIAYFLALGTLPTSAAAYALSQIHSAHQEATAVEHQTNDLAVLLDRYHSARPDQQRQLLQNLTTIAASRHQLLTSLTESDPGAVLRVALPDQLSQGLPPELLAYMEQKVELEGTLEVLYEDGDEKSRLLHFLQHGSERFSLHFKGRPPRLQTGARVRVKGVRVDDAIVMDSDVSALQTLPLTSDGSPVAPADSTPPTLPNTFSEQRTLALLVNFQDNPSDQPWTVEQARGVVLGEVSDFFQENSYGQTWVAGDVHGWHTIPVNSTSCDTTLIAQKADSAAAASGVDLSAYTRYVYIFPRNSACTWTGSGTVGGNPSRSWINGQLDLKVIGHEMGHNLGLQHSHALECGASILADNCQTYEYGDRVDIMGNYTAGHLNAFQKAELGWLGYGSSPPITSVETGGTFLLEPYELYGAGTRGLKILKNIDPVTGAKSWFYLEYRQALGFDVFLAGNSNILNGVVVHRGTDLDRNSSFLLDMTPESSTSGYYDWSDHALERGKNYTDPDSGVSITTVGTDSGGAAVTVDFGAQSCVGAKPALLLSPSESQWVQPGATVTYAVTVTNQDSEACGASQFNLEAAPPSGWNVSVTNPVLTLVPGQSVSTALTVTSPVSAADGFYSVAVTATSDAAPTYSAAGSVTYVVSAGTGNLAPIAVNDSAVTIEGTAVTIAVLANDSDPDGDPLSVISVTQAAHGQVSINGDGTVKYVPDRRFKGADSFSYAITDGVDTRSAAVALTVQQKSGGKPGGK